MERLRPHSKLVDGLDQSVVGTRQFVFVRFYGLNARVVPTSLVL